jgi:hypothetical protein
MSIVEESIKGSGCTLRLVCRGGNQCVILAMRGSEPKLITGYAFLSHLFIGEGTQLKCVVSNVDGFSIICLTAVQSIAGIKLEVHSAQEDMAIRLWLLETAVVAAAKPSFHFCLPHVKFIAPRPVAKAKTRPGSTVLWVTREDGHDSYALHHQEGVVGKALVPGIDLSQQMRGKFDVEGCAKRMRFLCKYHRGFGKWIPVRETTKEVSTAEEVRSVISVK